MKKFKELRVGDIIYEPKLEKDKNGNYLEEFFCYGHKIEQIIDQGFKLCIKAGFQRFECDPNSNTHREEWNQYFATDIDLAESCFFKIISFQKESNYSQVVEVKSDIAAAKEKIQLFENLIKGGKGKLSCNKNSFLDLEQDDLLYFVEDYETYRVRHVCDDKLPITVFTPVLVRVVFIAAEKRWYKFKSRIIYRIGFDNNRVLDNVTSVAS